MTQTPLWEIENTHPYYCTKGSYYRSTEEAHTVYHSWADFAQPTKGLTANEAFLEDKGNFLYDFDDDLNTLWRWDWNWNHQNDPEEAEECEWCDGELPNDCHELVLFFMFQRKAMNASVSVFVTKEDEPLVREWLKEKSQYMRKLWRPFLND